MTIIHFNQATFILSAAQLTQLPPDQGVEVAFAGRSNAGKSTGLNAITNLKRLAKTSKTPGCTQLINLFSLDAERRLVDLPGYGYAQVPEKVKLRWQKTLSQYLQERACLAGLVLFSDIRHPLQPLDMELISWAVTCKLPVHILLTKADKLSRSAALKTLQMAKNHLQSYPPALISLQIFSAQKHIGVVEARMQLAQWLQAGDASAKATMCAE